MYYAYNLWKFWMERNVWKIAKWKIYISMVFHVFRLVFFGSTSLFFYTFDALHGNHQLSMNFIYECNKNNTCETMFDKFAWHKIELDLATLKTIWIYSEFANTTLQRVKITAVFQFRYRKTFFWNKVVSLNFITGCTKPCAEHTVH